MNDSASIPDLRLDPKGSEPVYRQIASAVRRAVEEATLRPGDRLPPTRDLARRLGVNRNTVVAAFDLLAAEGAVVSHTGRGTFVADPSAIGERSSPAPTGATWFTAFSRAVDGAGVGDLLSAYRLATARDGVSFAASYPDPELLPVETFRRAMTATLREQGAEILSYGPTAGSPGLREALAAAMTRRGSRVVPGDVVVTNGSQQALELAFRTMVDRGDAVALEDPTYTGALSVLGALGARPVGIPVDREGIRSDLLELALERQRPKLLYLQPALHNPTACSMSKRRRREILALAERYRCPVVEDDWAGGLRFEGEEPPTLHAMDGGRHVVYLGTFSKKLLPGLRVGWVAAPSEVTRRLLNLKLIEDCGTSPLLQAALRRFLVEGKLDAHLRYVLPEYRRRRDAMTAALKRHFPESARWSVPPGGLFIWVTLGDGWDATALSGAAARRGVLFSPGELFHVGGGGRDTLRLTFAALPPERIQKGIEQLGKLMRNRGPGPAGAKGPEVAEAMPIL